MKIMNDSNLNSRFNEINAKTLSEINGGNFVNMLWHYYGYGAGARNGIHAKYGYLGGQTTH